MTPYLQALLPHQFAEMVVNFDEAKLGCQDLGIEFQESEADIVHNYRGRWG